jgi:hypothetical protein
MERTSTQVDEIYYGSYDRLGLIPAMMRRARARMLADFMSMMRPEIGQTIVDISVSDVINDEANFLEQHYPHRQDITCVGLGDGSAVLAAYPGVAYQRVEPNALLPFPDKKFAIATCNAVLEHVGGDAERRAFVAEMVRVADRVFVTVPNRWFPVEHHTATPLLHYWPSAFRAYCRATGKSHWASPANLEFLSASYLAGLFPRGLRTEVRYSGLPFGPFSSNLVCAATAT